MARHREVVDDVLRAWADWDLDLYESVLAEDAVEQRPQTGHRLVGRANIIGMYRAYPLDPPTIRWTSLCEADGTWIAEGSVDYGGGPVELVAIIDLADDRVSGADIYFAPPRDTSAPER